MADFKTQANRLADHLSRVHGIKLRHSSILETVAVMHGARDWNTLLAHEALSPTLNGLEGPAAGDTGSGLNLAAASDTPSARDIHDSRAAMAGPAFTPALSALEALGVSAGNAMHWLQTAVSTSEGLLVVAGPSRDKREAVLRHTAALLRTSGHRFLGTDQGNPRAPALSAEPTQPLDVWEFITLSQRRCADAIFIEHCAPDDNRGAYGILMACESAHKIVLSLECEASAQDMLRALSDLGGKDERNWYLPRPRGYLVVR